MNTITLLNESFNAKERDDLYDLIFTDIPYNIGKNAYASNPVWWKDRTYANGKSEKANKEFFELDVNFDVYQWLEWCYNHLKPDGKLITFCSFEQLCQISLNHLKFKKYKPLVFVKNYSAEVLKSNMGIVGACEYGIILYKNKMGVYNNGGKMVKNWFNFEKQYKAKHPNQKPFELCYNLLKLHTNEGDAVCDTCMGSGQIIKACRRLGLNATGFEIDEKYFEIAKQNIFGDGDIE